MTITQQLKNLSINGCISLDNALKLAKILDSQRDESTNLLTSCLSWVGMTLGESISTHLADVQGTYFSPEEYNAERLPGEQ